MTYTHDELRDTAEALDRLMRDVVPMLRQAAEDREALAGRTAGDAMKHPIEDVRQVADWMKLCWPMNKTITLGGEMLCAYADLLGEVAAKDAEIARLTEVQRRFINHDTRSGHEWNMAEQSAAERAKVRALRAQLERFASVNVLALMDALGLTGEKP